MELILSLISSSVKDGASETMMRTQQCITKTTDGSLPSAMLISTPSYQSWDGCVCAHVYVCVGGEVLIQEEERYPFESACARHSIMLH